MEPKGIQILFILKWISPIIYWFFYFTRSFGIFADHNEEKLNKTFTQSCRVQNRIILFTESFLLLMMWVNQISHNSSQFFKFNFYLLRFVYFLVNIFLVSLLVYFSIFCDILWYVMSLKKATYHHKIKTKSGMLHTKRFALWFSLSMSHKNLFIHSVKVND